jgi:hypothetical protein
MPVLSSNFLPGIPQDARLSTALSQAGRTNPNIMFQYGNYNNVSVPQVTYADADTDWRIRISLAPGAKYFSNDPTYNTLLGPLSGSVQNNAWGTYGVIFPYTPQISVTHVANYTSQKLTHNNYTQYFYDHSEVQPITITGDFTVQSLDEGQYLLAAIYFFRSLTKMFFGNDPQAGNPPPLVFLNGYGQYYFPNVPCVITTFSHTMPAEVDYLEIPDPLVTATSGGVFKSGQNTTRLPTTSQVSLTVQPVYSRTSQLNFSLNDFARGALINTAGQAMPASSYGAGPGNNAGYGTSGNGGFL